MKKNMSSRHFTSVNKYVSKNHFLTYSIKYFRPSGKINKQQFESCVFNIFDQYCISLLSFAQKLMKQILETYPLRIISRENI
ncbi:hypothetical protein BpHYR1_003627 [Brachionus plicatilis]|uniref:Uncharacterized protein n=1 Tax=Brachionus plicatilis TaxID=10195 RepID=A0A3M7PE65_BRAPC|nr:hypothetical protein BpHYR1_003627 [Brachionus plicatilis]